MLMFSFVCTTGKPDSYRWFCILNAGMVMQLIKLSGLGKHFIYLIPQHTGLPTCRILTTFIV